MKKLSFYEQVGIVIPGAVVLFGLLFYFPPLVAILAKDGISVGGLGVFVLVAYAAGHLVAGIGNVIESALWWFFGGMPSDWVVKPAPNILAEPQINRLLGHVRSRLGLELETVIGLERRSWWPISRQLYADVMKHGKPQRIDIFNGNYGLNRGLSAATAALCAVAFFEKDWWAALGLLVASAIYLFRAYRFGIHYARELYNQFLTLPAEKDASKPSNARQVASAADKKQRPVKKGQ